jgi:hypothetical protein
MLPVYRVHFTGMQPYLLIARNLKEAKEKALLGENRQVLIQEFGIEFQQLFPDLWDTLSVDDKILALELEHARLLTIVHQTESIPEEMKAHIVTILRQHLGCQWRPGRVPVSRRRRRELRVT